MMTLLVGGCAPTQDAAGGARTTQHTAPSTTARTTPGGADRTAPRSAPQRTRSPETAARGVPNESERFTVTGSVSPRCATIGISMIFRSSTRPGAMVVVSAAYSDQRTHGDHGSGNADARGAFMFRWTIKPDVPLGPAVLLVAASDYEADGEYGAHSTGEGDSARYPFTVESACP